MPGSVWMHQADEGSLRITQDCLIVALFVQNTVYTFCIKCKPIDAASTVVIQARPDINDIIDAHMAPDTAPKPC